MAHVANRLMAAPTERLQFHTKGAFTMTTG
jgi:hypothetical protein